MCSYVQFFADNHGRESSENKETGIETRKFFLNCLCLLLGRFDRKKLESIVSEYGVRISHVILPQVVVVKWLTLVIMRSPFVIIFWQEKQITAFFWNSYNYVPDKSFWCVTQNTYLLISYSLVLFFLFFFCGYDLSEWMGKMITAICCHYAIIGHFFYIIWVQLILKLVLKLNVVPTSPHLCLIRSSVINW